MKPKYSSASSWRPCKDQTWFHQSWLSAAQGLRWVGCIHIQAAPLKFPARCNGKGLPKTHMNFSLVGRKRWSWGRHTGEPQSKHLCLSDRTNGDCSCVSVLLKFSTIYIIFMIKVTYKFCLNKKKSKNQISRATSLRLSFTPWVVKFKALFVSYFWWWAAIGEKTNCMWKTFLI